MRPRLILSLACALTVLGGCSAANEPEEEPASGTARTTQAAPGAPIMLDTLAPDAISAAGLAGELGCSFAFSRGDEPLLMGWGFVDSPGAAEALMKVDGAVVKLAQVGGGGFEAMASGSTFSAEELSASVEVTGDRPLPEEPQVAMESPIHPARLTIERSGRKLMIDGFWECGP